MTPTGVKLAQEATHQTILVYMCMGVHDTYAFYQNADDIQLYSSIKSGWLEALCKQNQCLDKGKQTEVESC